MLLHFACSICDDDDDCEVTSSMTKGFMLHLEVMCNQCGEQREVVYELKSSRLIEEGSRDSNYHESLTASERNRSLR